MAASRRGRSKSACAAGGLARLAAAQRDHVRGRRGRAEVVVEAHDPVDLGHGQVERVGDDGDVGRVDVAERRQDLVQDGQQWPAVGGAMVLGEGADRAAGPLRRVLDMGPCRRRG